MSIRAFRVVIGFLIFLTSCKTEPEKIIPEKPDNFKNGYFIPCEGTYGFGNATVSFYDTVKNQIFNDVYQSANGKSLGDQLQSMIIFNGLGYLVVQNSQKIEIVDITNFVHLATIVSNQSLSSPRYCIGISPTKAYVSDWNADALAIIDLKTNQVSGSIAVGVDPDQLLIAGNHVFVANSGYATLNDNDNRISVIDTASDKLVAQITVGDRPLSIIVDKEGKVWVACSGFKKYDSQGEFSAESTAGSLYKINPSTFEIEKAFQFSDYNDNPGNLAVDPVSGDIFYTNKGKLWRQTSNGLTLENTFVLNHDFSGLAFDTENNKGLIGCISTNYTSAGKIIRYNADRTNADSVQVGIGPSAVVFRK